MVHIAKYNINKITANSVTNKHKQVIANNYNSADTFKNTNICKIHES